MDITRKQLNQIISTLAYKRDRLIGSPVHTLPVIREMQELQEIITILEGVRVSGKRISIIENPNQDNPDVWDYTRTG